MSLSLAAILATMTLPSCSWDRPGADPFMGDVVAAVDRYTDIPAPVRAKLKARMEARQYDEIAAIRRDSVTGERKYAPEIRDMHFGEGQVCRTVTRARWADNMVERGLVYCESGHCILVPTVCRNVSRIQRLGSDGVASAGDERLPDSEELVARSGAGDGSGAGGGSGGGSGGGGGGEGVSGGGDAPMVALGAAPSGEAAAGGAAGGASFQSTSGLPAFPVTALEFGGSAIALLVAAADGDAESGVAWVTGVWPGGVSTVPGAGAGSVGAAGGGDPGNAGTGGGNAGSFGSFGAAPPLSGLGGGRGGGGGGGLPFRLLSNDLIPEVSPVPEPGTWLMALLGLAGVIGAARRR